jgi:hypothetical protein
VRQELEPDQARQQQDEHAELEDAEDEPGSVNAGERLDERPLELLLDPGGCIDVTVEKIVLLAELLVPE